MFIEFGWILRRADRSYRRNSGFTQAGVVVTLVGCAAQPAFFDAARPLSTSIGLFCTGFGLITIFTGLWGTWKSRDQFLPLAKHEFAYLQRLRRTETPDLKPLALGQLKPHPLLYLQSTKKHVETSDAVIKETQWGVFETSDQFNDHLFNLPSIPFVERSDRFGQFFLSDAPDEDEARRFQLKVLVAAMKEVGETGQRIRRVNDSKFGIRFQPTIPVRSIEAFRVGYLDTLITNEAFSTTIRIGRRGAGKDDSDACIFPPAGSFPLAMDDKDQTCLAPSSDRTASHVGITTLALTRDRRLLFFQQNVDASEAARRLTLSGSGSVDYDDLDAGRPDGNFVKVIRHAMARELIEEAERKGARFDPSLKSQERIAKAAEETRLIQFFRWVDRSGKPEFSGITFLEEDWQDIRPCSKELVPIRYPILKTQQIDPDDASTRTLRPDVAAVINNIDDFSRLWNALDATLAQGNVKLSLSSFMCLRRLNYIATRARADNASTVERKIARDVARTLRISVH